MIETLFSVFYVIIEHKFTFSQGYRQIRQSINMHICTKII